MTEWITPSKADLPELFSLQGQTVHVWRADTNLLSAHLERFAQVLCREELARAGKFIGQQDRERFVIGRGLLRLLLGYYAEIEPREINLEYNRYGKPRIGGGATASGIYFNLSHSRNIILYAFTTSREIGVDIEHVSFDIGFEKIAKRFFSQEEQEAFEALEEEMKIWGFFNCWTRKEAYLKARGEGLNYPLTSFSVSLKPGEPPSILSNDEEPGDVYRWSMRELGADPDFVSVLVIEGEQGVLSCWSCEGEVVDSLSRDTGRK